MKLTVAGFYMGRFYGLDNFSAFRVEIFGRRFNTSEHAYQYAKFLYDNKRGNALSEELRQEIVLVRWQIEDAPSAHEAKCIGRDKKHLRMDDWDMVKFSIMKEILKAKFDQHSYIRKTLERTAGLYIVETSPIDATWGWGRDLRGLNRLGELWMDIRLEEFDIPITPKPTGIAWETHRLIYLFTRKIVMAA
jgi:ribA/ribD-fused uncharacterized protein